MNEPVRPFEARRFQRLLRFTAVVTLFLFVIVVVYYSLLLPLLVSGFLTYILVPLVDRLERHKVPRIAAVLGMVFVFVGALTLVIVRFAPLLYSQALLLIELMPRAVSTVLERWLPVAERYVADLGILTPEQVHHYISGDSLISRFENQMQAGLIGIWTTGSRLVGGMINVLLIPLLTFFFLKDYPRIASSLRGFIPRDLLGPVRMLLRRIDATMRTVLRGQAMVAGILAVMYVVGLSIAGLRSAIAIGVVAGLCRFVPYFDVIVGSILSTVVLLSDFQGWGQVLAVVIVFLVVQSIDGAFVTPAILGERIGLHPMAVIVSVIAFGNWFGFWGVILAVPVVAVLKVIYETLAPYYLSSRAYLASDES